MKFDNIELADGSSGARDGQGLKRVSTHYVADSHYGIGVADSVGSASGDLNEDYYVVWNEWPTMTGSGPTDFTNTVASTPLADIGINVLTVRCKATLSGTLDAAIIRKSDRKAVRIQISTATASHYKGNIVGNSTITAIDPKDGPRTPETGRLFNLGYV